MFNVIELIDKNPEFFQERLNLAYYWGQVKKQASRHIRRLDNNDLFDIARPNESKEIREFRNQVRRDFTVEGTWKWMSKVSRLFIENGMKVDLDTISDNLAEWIKKNPFVANGRTLEIESFMYQLILPTMIEDPNAILLPWPVIAPGDNTPPATPFEDGGVMAIETIFPENTIIPSSRIRFLNENIFAWEAGQWVYDEENDGHKPYYKIVDTMGYYLYIPVKTNDGIEYRLQNWYVHELGWLPVSILGGVLTRASELDDEEHFDKLSYFESYLRPYFELSDEAVNAFSDNQAIRLSHAYPKMVMSQIPCVNTQCRNGKVLLYDDQNKPVGKDICPDCQGAGFVPNPGPYNVLVKGDSGPDGDKGPILEYVAPPDGTVEHSYFVPWDLLTKAKKSIALDLLENVTESGVAKSLRLDDLRDILRPVSQNFFNIIKGHLFNVESLLELSVDKRIEPQVLMPGDVQYLDQETLKEQAEVALPADRYTSQMEYYRKKYVNNKKLVKVYDLSLKWAPILLAKEAEINRNLGWGIYLDVDLIKYERAFGIFREISIEMQDDQFMIAEDEKLFTLADKMLLDYLPAQPASVSEFEPPAPNAGQPVPTE